MEIRIRKRAFESMLAGAAAAHPNEFVCLLTGSREKGKVLIEDTMIPPGIMVSRTMSSFSDWMMPVMTGVVGTFHSHPGGSARPSRQDLRLFSNRGGVNFIAAEPFRAIDVAAFLGSGERVKFEVVE